MPDNSTDPREEAQPMSPEQLAALRQHLADEKAGVTMAWTMSAVVSNARTLAAHDHWRAMYRTGIEAYGDAHAEIEMLDVDRDEWKAAAQLRMTTGFAFGIRAQQEGQPRVGKATAWLAGFDFAAEMFGVRCESERGAADS